MSVDTVSLTGWGRTAPTTALRFRPRTYEEAAVAVRGCGPRGSIARGLGRAYGDAAQNAGGSVLDMTALNRIRTIDAAAGLVVCDAGVSLHRLMEVLLPLGWFVPVTPGTRYVTVGGAIGADIHGRNQHVSGSFSRHVRAMELLTADGDDPDGAARHRPLRRDRGRHGTDRGDPLGHAPAPARRDVTHVGRHRTGRRSGRLDGPAHRHRPPLPLLGRLDRPPRPRPGDRALRTHPRGARAPATCSRRAPGAHRSRSARAGCPRRPRSYRTGCSAVPRSACSTSSGTAEPPRSRTGELQKLSTFFHPLDAVPHWNRVYGRGGFVQYQFVVGHGQEEALRRIVRRISQRRCPSFLAVLKRFGDGDPGWLSFPMPGWTLALDLPADPAGPRRASSTSWTRRWPLPAAASTWRRTPGCGPRRWPPCIRDWPNSGRCAPSWTRTGRSARTSPAVSRSEPVPRPPALRSPASHQLAVRRPR